MHRLVLIVFLALVCVVFAQCPFHSKGTTEDLPTVVREITKASFSKAPTSSDPMQEMNHLLKQNYDATKQVMLQQYLTEWPLIFMDGENLIFWRDGSTVAHSVTPTVYTNLKLVCHTALGTFVLAQNALHEGGNVTSATRKSIDAYLSLFPESYETLPERGFTAPQLKMSEYLMDISSDLLQQILQDRYITPATLKSYSEKAVKPLNKLVDGAAKAQLHLCDNLVQEFKKNITDEEWDNLRVVLLGSHMARHGSLFIQYFEKAFDTTNVDERVIYAESLDTRGAMDLLSTYVIDGSAGEYFWNSPAHLHADVLASSAQQELALMFPNGQRDV